MKARAAWRYGTSLHFLAGGNFTICLLALADGGWLRAAFAYVTTTLCIWADVKTRHDACLHMDVDTDELKEWIRVQFARHDDELGRR